MESGWIWLTLNLNPLKIQKTIKKTDQILKNDKKFLNYLGAKQVKMCKIWSTFH